MDIVLEARDIFFRFDRREIFQGLNFRLWRGEIYVVLGASGSGKSVLLKILSGLRAPEKGSVEIEGIDLSTASRETLNALRARMGFVFQDAALISNMSIYDNVALPLRYHTRLGEAEVQARVSEKMMLFEVDRKFDHSLPALLSLEMRKKAALARALVLDPTLLFLDEPATGLSTEADRLITRVLKDYQHKGGATILVVTSEWPSAFPIAQRIGFLENGRIVAEGPAREMEAKFKKKIQSESFPE